MSAAANVPANSRLAGLAPAAIQHVVAAARALELGRIDEAERWITGLLATHPQHAEVQRLLAGTQSLRGQYEDAAATMRRALAARPDDALYLNTLGSILTEAGDYDAAATALKRSCELDPRLAIAWLNLGIALMRAMQPAESADALRRAVALAPDRVDAQCLLADQLKASGRVDAAIAEYRRVLARHPTAGMAWWGLADVKTVRLGAGDVERMKHAVHAPGTSADDRSAMYFALAKAYEDTARFPDALHALARAHAIARERQHWDAAAHAAFVDAVLAAFAGPGATRADESLGREAIFIVGLPRSGSSLTEQILASHSQVAGAGELPDLPRVLTDESRRRSQPLQRWAATASPDDWRRLGARYLERTARWRTQHTRSTDKLPYNWLYIGAIRAMLPGARIVVCRRDPLENLFACHRQRLTGNEYTRTFADLAAFWRDFDRAVRQWRTLHPGHVHELVHEALLADPEREIRALLAHCNLGFEPQCLEFHRTERDVHTPSAAQVREPLRRDTARAPAYGSLLDPLREALRLAGVCRQ